MSVTIKVIIVLLLIAIICVMISSEAVQSLPQIANRISVSPEGLPAYYTRAKPTKVANKIRLESENEEEGLMLDGSDTAIVPANKSKNICSLQIKSFDTNQQLFMLEASSPNKIVLIQTLDTYILSLCLNSKITFNYFAKMAVVDKWVNLKIIITSEHVIFTDGNSVISCVKDDRDKTLPSMVSFDRAILGEKAKCKIANADIFGTSFGFFSGNGYARFPLNRRVHITTYPLEVSFVIDPITDGAVILVFESDANYLKLSLKNKKLNLRAKVRNILYTHIFNYKFNQGLTKVKLAIGNNTDCVFEHNLEQAQEQGPVMKLPSLNLFWLSGAHRLFVGGIPLFLEENFTGYIADIRYRNVTSLF